MVQWTPVLALTPVGISLDAPPVPFTEKLPMPKPNYQFEKRQRELAKKKKKEEKAQRKSTSSPDEQPAEPLPQPTV